MKIRYTTTATLLGLGFLAGQAMANNITIQDNQPIKWGFLGDSGGAALTSGGFGQGSEDNEVETHKQSTSSRGYTLIGSDYYLNTTRSQAWDLEGIFLNGTSLSLVGGYDFLNGLSGGRPGDLFIKVGGSKPGTGPTTAGSGDFQNSAFGDGGYTYVVDLSVSAYSGSGTYANAAGFGPTAFWYQLTGDSMLKSVIYDQMASNAWKYEPTGGENLGLANLTYEANADITNYANFAGTVHNVLTIDLAGIFTEGLPKEDLWFSYTMQCGNDSIKGVSRVPDGGYTTILLGFALLALGLGRRMISKA